MRNAYFTLVVAILICCMLFPRNPNGPKETFIHSTAAAAEKAAMEILSTVNPKTKDAVVKRYREVDSLGNGFFGDTFIAKNSDLDNPNFFVLKKIRPQYRGASSFRLAGVREVYFGNKLKLSKPNDYTIRFVEAFDEESGLYIASLYEGRSLFSLLYEQNEDYSLGPTSWWMWLRTTSDGQTLMKELIYQLLKSVAYLHENGITHRDLKPGNIVVCPFKSNGSCLLELEAEEFTRHIHLRIIDFGSAIDAFSFRNLYERRGPSSMEQTQIYKSPEAFKDDRWLNGASTNKYDVWTVGYIIMEVILGTPMVFVPSMEEGRELLRSLAIAKPVMYDKLKWQVARAEFGICSKDFSRLSGLDCNDKYIAEYVKERDPLHIGFHDTLLLQLTMELLQWDPDVRISAKNAIRHPFFDSKDSGL